MDNRCLQKFLQVENNNKKTSGTESSAASQHRRVLLSTQKKINFFFSFLKSTLKFSLDFYALLRWCRTATSSWQEVDSCPPEPVTQNIANMMKHAFHLFSRSDAGLGGEHTALRRHMFHVANDSCGKRMALANAARASNKGLNSNKRPQPVYCATIEKEEKKHMALPKSTVSRLAWQFLPNYCAGTVENRLLMCNSAS